MDDEAKDLACRARLHVAAMRERIPPPEWLNVKAYLYPRDGRIVVRGFATHTVLRSPEEFGAFMAEVARLAEKAAAG